MNGQGLWFQTQNVSAGPSVTDKAPVIIVERNHKTVSVSVEEYLVYVLAAQIHAEFEKETLKAQAILARTYIYDLMFSEKDRIRWEIHEEELDMDALSMKQMKTKWGEEQYPEYLEKLQSAIRETEGMYIICEGKIIEPLFCYASAGKTRSYGDELPYLKSVESSGDLSAERWQSLPIFEIREFAKRINEIPGAVTVTQEELKSGEGIQIIERDEAGYVKHVQIGQKTYTGEEVQYALGLASANYSFEYLGGKIRIICKGIGHGYGFAQFGANEMAKEGKTYEELLKYYFAKVDLVTIR